MAVGRVSAAACKRVGGIGIFRHGRLRLGDAVGAAPLKAAGTLRSSRFLAGSRCRIEGFSGMKNHKRVLVLCTGNSARSKMGEGLFRREGAGEYEVFSAGTKPS